MVAPDGARKLRGLALALDALASRRVGLEAGTEARIDAAIDAAIEAPIEQRTLNVIEEAVAAWSATWTRMLAVWPEVVRCLDAAVSFLDRLHEALATSGARMAQVNAARARLH